MTTIAPTDQRLDFESCYRALASRDARFDGQFVVTVHTTGIYCRPSCPAQTPKPENVHFVLTAATAHQQGYRACRRCAPDAVPGSPRWNTDADLSSRAMRLIVDGVIERDGVDGLATRLGYTARHLNRILTEQLGAGPLALARAHRAATARVLIQCTSMSMSDIAFAAGFRSIRQFNDTIREVFALTPSQLRSLPARHRQADDGAIGEVTLRLAYRPPLDSAWLHWFLAGHAVTGVEQVDDIDGIWSYRRTMTLPHGPALVTLTPDDDQIVARLAHLDMRDLAVGVNRLRRFLDLDADTAAADTALHADPVLRPLVARAPGIRVPGSTDAAETLIRTMIGQQISVKAAGVHVARLVEHLGEPVPWTHDATDPGPTRLFPTAAAIAEHGAEVLTGPRRRIDAIIGAASAIADNRLDPHAGVPTSELRGALLNLPGVGPWTADYVTMRVTGDPDTLLDRDLVVAQAAAELGVDLRAHGSAWKPWRSYASMHLWRHRLSKTEPLLQPDRPLHAGITRP